MSNINAHRAAAHSSVGTQAPAHSANVTAFGLTEQEADAAAIKAMGAAYFGFSHSEHELILRAALAAVSAFAEKNGIDLGPGSAEAMVPAAGSPRVPQGRTWQEEQGVFKAGDGLQRLADCQTFWDKQPYGTRLYFEDSVDGYLHRGVLQSALRALESVEAGERIPDQSAPAAKGSQ